MPPHSRLGDSSPGPLRTSKECSKAGGQPAWLPLGSTPEPCLCPSFCSRVPRWCLLRARGSHWWGTGCVCDFPHPLRATACHIGGASGMELVEARGATQQLPSGQDSPNPENNWSQVSTVTRGQKHQPGSNMPDCFLCSAGKETKTTALWPQLDQWPSPSTGAVPLLSPSSTPTPPAKPLPHPHTVSGRLSPCLSPGLAFYLCKGPEAGYSVETVSMGPRHPRDPE